MPPLNARNTIPASRWAGRRSLLLSGVLYAGAAIWAAKIALVDDPPPAGQPAWQTWLGPLLVFVAGALKTVFGLVLYFVIPALLRRRLQRGDAASSF